MHTGVSENLVINCEKKFYGYWVDRKVEETK